jgi:hypothetical protein
MELTCPGCQNKFNVEAKATISPEDILYLNIKSKSELMEAGTIGKLIQNMEGLQRAVGKDLGYKVIVFVISLEYKPYELTIGYKIVQRVSDK